MPATVKVPLARLRLDGGTQARTGLCEEQVRQLQDLISEGIELDPIEVVDDGTHLWPFDGFHRIRAYQSSGATLIPANVRKGTQRDAQLLSCGANARHGLKRSNADKRKAVETLLRDPEWRDWSDRAIAKACCVDASFVGSRRQVICASESIEAPTVRTYEQQGQVKTMNVTTQAKGGQSRKATAARAAAAQPPAAAANGSAEAPPSETHTAGGVHQTILIPGSLIGPLDRRAKELGVSWYQVILQALALHLDVAAASETAAAATFDVAQGPPGRPADERRTGRIPVPQMN